MKITKGPSMKHLILAILAGFAVCMEQPTQPMFRKALQDKRVQIGLKVAAVGAICWGAYKGYKALTTNPYQILTQNTKLSTQPSSQPITSTSTTSSSLQQQEVETKIKSNSQEALTGNISDYDEARDFEQVSQLYKDSWENMGEAEEYSSDHVKKLLNLKTPSLEPELCQSWQGKLIIKVLRQDNNVVGLISYYGFGQRTNLHNLIVDTKCRRKGYGKQLMEHMFQELRSQGIKVVQLSVLMLQSSLPAIKMYVQAGFTGGQIMPHVLGLAKTL